MLDCSHDACCSWCGIMCLVHTICDGTPVFETFRESIEHPLKRSKGHPGVVWQNSPSSYSTVSTSGPLDSGVMVTDLYCSGFHLIYCDFPHETPCCVVFERSADSWRAVSPLLHLYILLCHFLWIYSSHKSLRNPYTTDACCNLLYFSLKQPSQLWLHLTFY